MKLRNILFSVLLAVNAYAQSPKQPKPLPPVALNTGGTLVYMPDAQGNRIPDFSYCGYMAAEQSIPDVPVRIVVPLIKGDATAAIQAALDQVSALPVDQQGIRGAVLLQKGQYEIKGSLTIRASGVILRGSGMNEAGTILNGTGFDRQTLIRITGVNNRSLSTSARITNAYVPVNASALNVDNPQQFRKGDKVLVHRPSTIAWIKLLGADHFGGGITALGWKPGERDIDWDRTVTAIDGNTIILDAPLTTALDTAYGGATIAVYQWPGRISHSGVENLRCRSAYDKNNAKDEDHRWMAITLENISDAWVRQITFEHFAGSAVAVLETAKRVTIEDCVSLSPVSEIGGQRRYTFFTTGQQTLFQRLYAEHGYHDFAVGFCAAGPNAFVQCEAHLPFNFSGAIDSWASGVLFDIVNIDGQALRLGNRGQDGQGAGWSAANSVLWQCSASRIDCYRPPGANNWCFGAWAQFQGDGYWGESNEHVQPRSLYYAQLSERLGKEVLKRAQLLPVESEASSSPSVQVAAALTAVAVNPLLQLKDWIAQASQRNPIPANTAGIKTLTAHSTSSLQPQTSNASPMHLSNGWLVRGNALLTGRRHDVPWWRGNVHPDGIKEAVPDITRFVPGRSGTGLTDDLQEVSTWMKEHHIVALEHNYGLWYERRRDDHERVRRMDGDVWPPFYEQPFARTGQDAAWDGLSRYDLTKYNHWYWLRLKQFANLADQQGLVLVHQNYFQHNIIEAGAHWADCPWRPANNINNTGFPEPPPYAGDKRIFMAAQFYDVNHPVRRKLHRAYIRQCLENFAANNGVIQLIGQEFTGPLSFVQFWIDTILEWEKETGKQVTVGLSVTKDVQDAILADPARSRAISVIDIRQWHYQQDSSAYAPQGGQNLAPRQHARLLKPKRSTFAQVYRAVREYRDRYPAKAVIYTANAYDEQAWAVFMAGGSLAGIPAVEDGAFLQAASSMQPAAAPSGEYMLSNNGKEYIIYSTATATADLTNIKGSCTVEWIDPKDGHILKTATVTGGSRVTLDNPGATPVVLWIKKV